MPPFRLLQVLSLLAVLTGPARADEARPADNPPATEETPSGPGCAATEPLSV